MKPISRPQTTHFRTLSTHAKELSDIMVKNLDEMPSSIVSSIVVLLHIITFSHFSLIDSFTAPFSTHFYLAKTLHYTYGLYGYCTAVGGNCKRLDIKEGFFDMVSDPNIDWVMPVEWRDTMLGVNALLSTLSVGTILLSLLITVCAFEDFSLRWHAWSLICNVFACIATCAFTSCSISTYHPNGSPLLWASIPVSTGLIASALLQIHLLVRVYKYNKRNSTVSLIDSPIEARPLFLVDRARRMS
ncbi:unnamed protein product [Ambrosiozyma monospora]|uniref:Unnamed protein product n=1 Tax=Ambrosiozyma monospora TaxID=43982 RepID=A0ACB5STL4_AMBMO|nr:unnamed protein product [Ambrosiozyma monospora]